MPQTKISALRESSSEELAQRLQDLKQETINLRLQAATGQLENVSRARLVRREIARIQTIVSERRNKAQES